MRTTVDESENRSDQSAILQALVESSPLGILVLDAGGTITHENPAMAGMMGVPEGSTSPVLGLNIQDLAPLREAGLTALVDRVFAGHTVRGETVQYTSLMGRRLTLELHAAPLEGDGGRFEGAVVMASDVTERERTEAELRESHATLNRFMEMSPVGLGFARGRVMMRGNEAMYRMFGYEKEQIEGRDTRLLYATDQEYERVGRIFAEQIHARGRVDVETQMVRRDGTVMDCLMQGYPVEPGDEDSVVVVGIMDISGRRQQEQRMRRLQSAMEQAAEMIVLTDMDGVVQFANPAFERMTGLPLSEVRGERSRPIIEQIIAGASFGQIAQTIREGQVWQDRVTVRRRDGRQLDIEATVSPVRNEKGELVSIVSVARDVTREVELEGQLRHAQKMEAIGTLAGGIAHDFNNLLHAILGFSELSMRMVEHDSRVYANLQEVVAAAQRARDLIDQVLTFSRRTEQQRQRMYVQPIVKEVVRLLRGSLPSTIEVVTEIDEDCGPVKADPTQIHQVILNICTNAFKAMRQTGGTLRIRLARMRLEPQERPGITHLPEGLYALVLVEDTGHGMDRKTQERIFDPYFSAWGTDDGTGLGLAMVHGIVRNHGGWVDVQSEPGQGTRFFVYLPVTGDGAGVKETGSEGPRVQRLTGRVLFVDDEEANVKLGEQVLGRLGCQVRSFGSSKEALEAFRSAPASVDAVITDQTMPALTGAELSREMLRIRPDLPIAISTGFSDNLTEERARQLGIREFLTKPLSVSDLEGAARRLLEE